MSQMSDILQDIYAGVISATEMDELPCSGQSPWGGRSCPPGVWAWNELDDEMIIGEDELELVTYDQARAIFGHI